MSIKYKTYTVYTKHNQLNKNTLQYESNNNNKERKKRKKERKKEGKKKTPQRQNIMACPLLGKGGHND